MFSSFVLAVQQHPSVDSFEPILSSDLYIDLHDSFVPLASTGDTRGKSRTRKCMMQNMKKDTGSRAHFLQERSFRKGSFLEAGAAYGSGER
jgi:hypothetical protein